LVGALADETSRGLTVRLWDLEKGRLERRLVGQSGEVAGVALSPSGEWAAAAAASGVHLWKARDADGYNKLDGPGAATAVAFRDDSALLAGAVGARVRLWDTEQHKLKGLVITGQEVTALTFVPGGKLLATAGKDGSVKLWDLAPMAGKLPTPEPLKSLLEIKPFVDTWDKARGAETKARLQALAAQYPKDPDTLLLLAQATFLHSEGKEMPQMRQILAQGLQLEPGHYWIHRLLGEIDYQTQQYDDAVRHLQATVDQNPNSVSSLARLAAIAGAKKDAQKATLLAGRVWQLVPSETAAYNLACAFSLQRKTGEALDWLERAFKLGFVNYDGLKGDTDLDNLRALPRYAQLVRDYSHGEATASSTGTAERADQLREQADAARQAEKREESIALYKKSIAEERASPKPRESKIRRDLLWLATAHRSLGNTDEAIHAYEECVQLSERVGGGTDDDVGTMGRQLLAGLYKSTGQHGKSLELYLKVLPMVRARGEKGLEAVALQNVGRAYAAVGRYDKALDYLNQAQALLEATLRAGDKSGEKRADSLSNLLSVINAKGEVFADWGQPDKAMELYQQQLKLARAQGTPGDVLDALSPVALTLQATGKYEQSIATWNEYLAGAKAKGDLTKLSIGANAMAQCYARWGKMDEALVWSNEALARARQTGKGIHASLVSTARLYERKGDRARAVALMEEELALTRKGGREDEIARSLRFVADTLPEERAADSIRLFTEALAIYDRRGDAPMQAATHKDLGVLELKRERYPESASHLATAVQLYEQLRKTAQGEARRDFLAKTVITYEALILAQLRAKDTPGAFRTMELSRSKLLAERIAGADQVSIPQIAELPGLAGAGAILMFSNADLDQPVHFVMNKSGMQAWPRPLPPALKQKLEGGGVVAQAAAAERDRGLKKRVAGAAEEKERTPLERAVELYRSLLIHPSPQTAAAARELGKLFYEALIEPSLKYLVPGQTLLIVPDGVLAFLPFETLIDPQGRYLADVYDIRYVQSLSVLQQIRKRFLPPGRKPLLAFGGAVYSQATYAQDMKPEGPALLAMADAPVREFTRGASARDAYAAMGVRWDNLPGTLAEVKALQQLIPGAELVTGEGVSEAALKKLSESGELGRYQTLHFATHGMVVPQQPELSALVLSQVAGDQSGQDGYLLMDEIAGLKLQADFVALSACETGLGKIYGGEGVVGLTQAFLIAGANGLSVSLWQVADESTARFMLEVYKLQRAGTHDWPAAISAVKRRFAKGDFGAAWKDPHYWAPFVYYGR
jgi:CHAT domain-containing protein/WD40 repeat protein